MSRKAIAPTKKAASEPVRPHQPGQATFRAILPEEIDWKPFPAFPPSARLAVVVGQPLQKGPYTIRVKVPRGVKLMPHTHPKTGSTQSFPASSISIWVMSSMPRSCKPIRPGSVVILPGNTSHFHWAKSGDYITQVTAIGPLGLEYVNAKDDPRNKS